MLCVKQVGGDGLEACGTCEPHVAVGAEGLAVPVLCVVIAPYLVASVQVVQHTGQDVGTGWYNFQIDWTYLLVDCCTVAGLWHESCLAMRGLLHPKQKLGDRRGRVSIRVNCRHVIHAKF